MMNLFKKKHFYIRREKNIFYEKIYKKLCVNFMKFLFLFKAFSLKGGLIFYLRAFKFIFKVFKFIFKAFKGGSLDLALI